MNHSRHIAWLWLFMLALTGYTVYLTVRPAPLPHKADIRYAPADEQKPKSSANTLPSGYIRDINWEKRLVEYESDKGFTTVLGPICKKPDMLPVWKGEHVYGINFHWVGSSFMSDGEEDGKTEKCYVFDGVGHDAANDIHEEQKPKPPVDASGVSK
jgi:hypothetical protein